MPTAILIDFSRERAHRQADQAALLAQYDHLACPKCSRVVAPIAVTADPTVTYECAGPGHRRFAWRINPDGEMLHGRRGNRVYRI